MDSELDKFYAKVWNIGSDSKGITIPANLIKGLGIQTGDEIIVWIKKHEV